MDSFSIVVFLVAFTLHATHGVYNALLSPFISDYDEISDHCPLILRIAFNYEVNFHRLKKFGSMLI